MPGIGQVQNLATAVAPAVSKEKFTDIVNTTASSTGHYLEKASFGFIVANSSKDIPLKVQIVASDGKVSAGTLVADPEKPQRFNLIGADGKPIVALWRHSLEDGKSSYSVSLAKGPGSEYANEKLIRIESKKVADGKAPTLNGDDVRQEAQQAARRSTVDAVSTSSAISSTGPVVSPVKTTDRPIAKITKSQEQDAGTFHQKIGQYAEVDGKVHAVGGRKDAILRLLRIGGKPAGSITDYIVIEHTKDSSSYYVRLDSDNKQKHGDADIYRKVDIKREGLKLSVSSGPTMMRHTNGTFREIDNLVEVKDHAGKMRGVLYHTSEDRTFNADGRITSPNEVQASESKGGKNLLKKAIGVFSFLRRDDKNSDHKERRSFDINQ